MSEDEEHEIWQDGYQTGKGWYADCVYTFHYQFGLPRLDEPTVPPADRRILRVKLLLEEVLEFAQASGITIHVPYDGGTASTELSIDELTQIDYGTCGDWRNREPLPTSLVDAADALADILYVTEGAALEWGIPLWECFEEVHSSNMSKLDSEGKPLIRDDGKVLKGPNYFPPNLEPILRSTGKEPK